MAKSRRKAKAPAPPETTQTVAAPTFAPLGIRLIAVVYDALLIIALNAIVGAILISIATPHDVASRQQMSVLSPSFRHFVLFPTLVLVTWLFYGYFWRKAGQTLGMQTWRLRVVKADGRLLGWSDAFGRCAAAMLLPSLCGLAGNYLFHSTSVFGCSLLFGFVGNYAWGWINRQGLAWHDQLSGTVVVRVPKETSPQRGWLGWFSDDKD